MLATALDDAAFDALDPEDYLAEWKWDGIRVQVTAEGDTRRIYSRTGDDISRAFPRHHRGDGFSGRAGRRTAGRATGRGGAGDRDVLRSATTAEPQDRDEKDDGRIPAFVRAYDLLDEVGEKPAPLPFADRRARLEAFAKRLDPYRFDLSPLVPFTDWDHLRTLREDLPHPVIEGLMLKRKDAPYVPGRPKGPWFKWKRDPLLIDAVLMYAQRGHGRRSSFYSDYTFGVWSEDGELFPVGKAYFGFTDEELKKIDVTCAKTRLSGSAPSGRCGRASTRGLSLRWRLKG